MADQPFARNVNLDERTVEIVETHAEKTGIANFSASLRVIIREWKAMKASQNAKQVQPQPAQNLSPAP